MRKIKTSLKIKRREVTLALVCMMVLILFFSGYSIGKEHSSSKIATNLCNKENSI
ncbi:MAG: hypothetical protein HFJ35_05100 [Clostridia bacterium]|nr:hypothetical protein [Clostridia bacterium]